MSPKRNLVKAVVAAGLTVALTSGIALASIGTGTVTASSLRLRSEATIQSATLAYAPKSSQVSILESVSNGWYKVTYNGVEGYMSGDWLDVELTGDDAEQEAAELKQAVVTDGPLNVRSGAGTSFDRVGTLNKGDLVSITDESVQGWYGILYGDVSGYVSADYLSLEVATGAASTDEAPAEETVSSREAIVTADVLNVRSGAGTSYERVGVLKEGDLVTVTDESISGWYGITSGNVSGYASADYLSFDVAAVQESLAATAEPKEGMVTTSVLNVRSGAGTSYARVGTLSQGASVTITDESVSGWYGITSGDLSGYVSADYIAILDGSSTSSSVGAAAASLAASLVGKPYVYGAAGPNSFDCSGLFYYIFNQLGVNIARTSSSQYYNSGTFVSVDEMQPGDLVYLFDPKYDYSGGSLPTTHVLMYIGNNTVLHASTTSNTVRTDTLFGGYYGNYVVAVKRMG